MFLFLFPSELNVNVNFHTTKESVVAGPVWWQWCFDHSPAKPELSLISPASKYYMWEHSISKIFSSYTLFAQQMSDAALPVVLLEHFRFLLRRRRRRGTGKMLDRNQRCRGGEKPDYSGLEGVWERQQWPVPLIQWLYCLARSPYLCSCWVSITPSSGSCCGALA